MHIELMKETDVDEVYDIEVEAFAMPWSKKSLLEAVTDNNARYLVLHFEGEVVGYVGMWYGGDEAEITNVAVSSKYRQQGFGYTLMESAKKQAEIDGMGKLFLEVRVSNEPAKMLYIKTGFKSIGVRKNFYEKPVEDACVMVLRIGKEGENPC